MNAQTRVDVEPPEPDVETALHHLDVLFAPAREAYPGGLVELRWGSGGQIRSFAYYGMAPERLAEAAEFAIACNRRGCNVYVGVNPRKPSTSTRNAGTAKDVEIAFWHFADLDKADAVAMASERTPLPNPPSP